MLVEELPPANDLAQYRVLRAADHPIHRHRAGDVAAYVSAVRHPAAGFGAQLHCWGCGASRCEHVAAVLGAVP